jgi:hypothetical protein
MMTDSLVKNHSPVKGKSFAYRRGSTPYNSDAMDSRDYPLTQDSPMDGRGLTPGRWRYATGVAEVLRGASL